MEPLSTKDIVLIVLLCFVLFVTLYYTYWHDLKFQWFKCLKKEDVVLADFALYGGSTDYITLKFIIHHTQGKYVYGGVHPQERALAKKDFGPQGLIIRDCVHYKAIHPLRGKIQDHPCFKTLHFRLFKIWIRG